ncbi:MAG: IclR family transcriptional regulator, partial [Bacillota bacterium]
MSADNRQTQTQVVRRIADILRLWISHRGTMSVREVAERLGLARTTTHRLMADLENEGFLRSDGNGRYELGFFPVRLAERVREGLKIVEVARSHMMALRDLSRETVALHIRDDIVRRCIYQVESPQQLRRVYTDVGGSIPLYAGAASLVMLAHLPEEALQRIVDDGLQPIAPNTITDWPKLREEMDRILEEGVAVSRSQRTPGIAAV